MLDSGCRKALGEITLEFVANQIDSPGETNRIITHFDDFRLWVYVLVDDMCKQLEGHRRRIGLLCIVILPLLLTPQARAAARPNEFSGAGTASVLLQPATADQYVPLQNAVQVVAGDRHSCALIDSSEAAAPLSKATTGFGDGWLCRQVLGRQLVRRTRGWHGEEL